MMSPEPLPRGTTAGSLVVSLQPRLFFVGDYVTRCLLQRVRSWRCCLGEARAVIYEALKRIECRYENRVAAERRAWDTLHRRSDELETMCLHGTQARLRDACVGAVQLYAEFHPTPDLQWLGLEPALVQRAKGVLRHNLLSSRDLESFERIANVLGSLQGLYRDADPQQSDLEAAIATGDLVIVDRPGRREAYWETRPIEVDWFDFEKPWELLCQLARNARYERPVGHLDLYEEGVAASTMANRWRRLKGLIPATLARYVRPGREPATYLLTLPLDRIHIHGEAVSAV